MTLKWLFSILVIVILGGGGYYYYQNFYQKEKKQPEKISDLSDLQNKISIDPDWPLIPGINTNPSLSEKNIPEIIAAANKYISDIVGEEFFKKYIKYNPGSSTTSEDGSIYYLDYIVTIPEKGIDFKTTTHPTKIEINLKKDLSLVNPVSFITGPNCRDLTKCDFITREEVLEIAKLELEKEGISPEELKGFVVDFLFQNRSFWRIKFNLPQEKTPKCEFKMGGWVSFTIDALTKTIGQKERNCYFPGV